MPFQTLMKEGFGESQTEIYTHNTKNIRVFIVNVKFEALAVYEYKSRKSRRSSNLKR